MKKKTTGRANSFAQTIITKLAVDTATRHNVVIMDASTASKFVGDGNEQYIITSPKNKKTLFKALSRAAKPYSNIRVMAA